MLEENTKMLIGLTVFCFFVCLVIISFQYELLAALLLQSSGYWITGCRFLDSVCVVFSFKHLQFSANHPRLSELLCAFQSLLKRLLQKLQTKGTSRPATCCFSICYIHS